MSQPDDLEACWRDVKVPTLAQRLVEKILSAPDEVPAALTVDEFVMVVNRPEVYLNVPVGTKFAFGSVVLVRQEVGPDPSPWQSAALSVPYLLWARAV